MRLARGGCHGNGEQLTQKTYQKSIWRIGVATHKQCIWYLFIRFLKQFIYCLHELNKMTKYERNVCLVLSSLFAAAATVTNYVLRFSLKLLDYLSWQIHNLHQLVALDRFHILTRNDTTSCFRSAASCDQMRIFSHFHFCPTDRGIFIPQACLSVFI